jgi:hypothetical protein
MQVFLVRREGPLWMPLAGALVLSLIAGCSSQSSNADGGDVIDCSADARVTAYSPAMSVSATSGSTRYTLMQANPAPPAVGVNTWTLRMVDSSGHALANLFRPIDYPFMPDHGHGSSVRPQANLNADNSYTITNLYFFMPGVWRITFSTMPDASPTNAGIFFFCVPG